MTRAYLGACVMIALTMVAFAAAPPPLWRNLSKEEEKQVAQLNGRLGRHWTSGEFEKAVGVAKEIAALRAKKQGASHWQAVDASFRIEDWQRLARVPGKDWAALVQALALSAEGQGLLNKGGYREAEKPLRAATAFWQKALGEDHPDTATSYNNVANCLYSQGKHVEALPLYRRALAIRQKALGEEHPETARSYNNVALCLNSLGKYAPALPLLRRALAIQQKALGEEHPDTARSYNNVALCLYYQGKYAEALPLLRRALAILQKALGEEHPDTARSYNNVALCLDSQGKYAEALPQYRCALAILQKALGEEHPDTATSYNSVAGCLNRQGKYAEALPLLRRALAIYQKAWGEEHPDTGDIYNNVALCLDSQGKHAEALPLLRRALAIYRKARGEEHPSTAGSYNNVALCLDSQGKHAEALPLLRRALAIYRKARGEEHPSTAASYNNVANCLNSQGKYAEALPLLRCALAIQQKALREEHPDTAASYNNVANCLDLQGKFAEALPLFRRALAIQQKALGEEHLYTAKSYNSVAGCLYYEGKQVEAQALFRRALANCQKALGDEHPETARSSNGLAYCLNSQGKHAEALRLLQASLAGQEAARYHTASSGFDRAFASAGKASPHAMLAIGLARLGQPRNAFRHAEFALARGLLDDLSVADPEDLQRIATLSTEIDSLNTLILPLTSRGELSEQEEGRRLRLVRQRRLLEGERSQLASAISARQVLTLERIQKQIPDDAALVLWIDAFNHQVACVLRRAGPPVWETLPGSGKAGTWTKDDIGLAGRAYDSLTDPAQRDLLRQALYQQRLAPLEPHLKGVKRLFVVPTGAMARVPVEALTERWLVSYVPSGSAFARAAERPAAKRSASALVLADPVFTATPPAYPKAPPHGLLVTAVVSGGLAQRIGLRSGDVLLEYAGKTLALPDDLKASEGDERVPIKLWREGKSMGGRIPAGTLGVVVDKRKVADALAAWRDRESKLLASRGGKEYDALPGTRLEAHSLAKLFADATTLLGSEASEQNLERLVSAGKLKGVGILHLATHGEANQTRPRNTALILSQDRLPTPKEQEARVLAGKRPVEGRLTVGAVLDGWQLDAELVTLSACQTGLGADTAGEGMLGFAQALLQKGARSVLLSRWKVDDGATSLLMVRFYENLLGKREGLKEPMPKAEALREAKAWLRDLPREEALRRLATLVEGVPRGERGTVRPALPARATGAAKAERPYAHPYFWAAFVLVGDPR